MSQTEHVEAIKRLKARYFRFMDTKDWQAWGQVFTHDATMAVDYAVSTRGAPPDTGPIVSGRREIVDFVRERIDACITVHHGHMPEIELLSPTTARGVWAMEDIVEFPDRVYQGHGHYHETYRLESDGAWRIQSLHLTRIRLSLAAKSASGATALPGGS